MNEWLYSFDPVSKAAWIEQIERELKGKLLSTLHHEWWPGAPLDPMHHGDDQNPHVALPDHLFATPPIIAEYVDARGLTATQLNSQLLAALRFGAEQFIIQANEKTTFDDDAWLTGIHSDMVRWHFIGDSVSPAFQYVWNSAPGKTNYRIERLADDSFDKLVDRHDTFPDNCKLVYHFPSTGTWDEQCAEVFNAIIEDAKGWKAKSSFFDHCILSAEAATDYLKCIIQLRTLHVVWQNLLDLHREQRDPLRKDYLECHITPGDSESPEAYLVKSATAAVGSVLAGAGVLCIQPLLGTTPDYYKRINRNIHHLLYMESGLPRQLDPLAGSYAIDHYTVEWSNRIWESLKL